MSTSESCSSGKRKAYGEVTTKRLCKSFQENNYPDCDTKEKFEQSGGSIKALLEEAENERMHLITMVELVRHNAIDYWRLPKDVTLKDVDEAYHRDVNYFASP
ncbi:hypothetical protein FXO38_33619 [Capsicum annuum]|nr:hypothetical protein FXO38_33619 [Capsicum annuum]KAF3647007.1 hypothetical protein FXO37_20191 [Capsicum annuum]